MEDLNLKVFLTKSGVYFVGNLIPSTDGKVMLFDFLFMLAPHGDKLAMVPFGMNIAKDRVSVNSEDVSMIADAAEELLKNYQNTVNELKAARSAASSGIVVAPAGALSALPNKQRPDVQKLF